MPSALLLPLGYAPLHPTTGALVPNGYLHSYRAGTSTPQSTYSDAALQVANSSPIQLSAAGLLTTEVWGDQDSGFDYKITLSDSASTLLDTWDDIVCGQPDVATIQEGSFTGTLTGMTGSTTGTVSYRIVSNIGGTGKLCTLSVATSILGTSNTTSMTMTGLPAAVRPSTAIYTTCPVADADVSSVGAASIAAAGSTITFECDATLSTTGFTNSGAKGLSAGWTITYPL